MNFNKQQEEIINGNISVIASAGTGKPSVFTYRIKNMVENYGIPPPSILVIVFSKDIKSIRIVDQKKENK